jgi:hypothetical protein
MCRTPPRPRPTASDQRLHVRQIDDRPRLPRFLGKLPQSPTTSDSQKPALGRVSHVASVFNQVEHLVERVHVVNRSPHDAKPLGRLAIVQRAPAVAFNEWDIVAPASVHFQFARRRICRVLAFSNFAETASGSSAPPSALEASNSVRHAATRTAGGTAELPAIIFKTTTGSRSSGATSGTATLRGRPPRLRRGLRGVSMTSTIVRNPLACTDFPAAWRVSGIFIRARRCGVRESRRG